MLSLSSLASTKSLLPIPKLAISSSSSSFSSGSLPRFPIPVRCFSAVSEAKEDALAGFTPNFSGFQLEETVATASGKVRLDSWISTRVDGISRARVQSSIKLGLVRVNGEVVDKVSQNLKYGDKINCTICELRPLKAEPEEMPLDIVYEDDSVIVVDKPAHMVVHPAPGNPTGTLVNGILHHCSLPDASFSNDDILSDDEDTDDESRDISVSPSTSVASVRPGIVHRLDKGTSGLLVVAKVIKTGSFDFETLIRNRCLSGNLSEEEAKGYFEFLVETKPFPSIWSFNHLFGSLSKSGSHALVVSMFRSASRIPGFEPGIGTLTIFMKSLSRSGKPDLGVSVFSLVLKRGMRPSAHTLSTLLHALCSVGSASEAAELFDELAAEEFPRNEFAYAALINGLCKGGEADVALRILRRMYSDPRARPDSNCFGPIVDGLCKVGRISDGLTVFREMISERVPPHVAVCNSLLRGLCRSGNWVDAEAFLEDMARDYGVSPNVITYNIVIDALCKGGRCEQGISVFRSMLAHGFEPSVVSFGSVLCTLCRSGRLEEALRVFETMSSFGVCPNVVMFTIVFDALCKKGRISDALELVGVMAGRGINPDVFVYTSLIQGFCRLRRVDLGFGVLATMFKRGVRANSRTLVSLLRGLCARGSMLSAAEFFRRLEEKDRTANSEFSYAVFINGLCKAGETREALELLERMCDDPSTKPDAFCYNPIIDRLCKERRFDEALSLFEKMVKGSLGKAVKKPNVATFNSLISAFCKRGRWSEASEILGVMNGLGISQDVFTLSSIVDALCKEMRISMAIDLADKMALCGIRSNAVVFNSFIHGFCHSGQWREATECLERMEARSVSPSVVTFTILADSLDKQRRTREALDLLRNMVQKGIVPDRPAKQLLQRILTRRV